MLVIHFDFELDLLLESVQMTPVYKNVSPDGQTSKTLDF